MVPGPWRTLVRYSLVLLFSWISTPQEVLYVRMVSFAIECGRWAAFFPNVVSDSAKAEQCRSHKVSVESRMSSKY